MNETSRSIKKEGDANQIKLLRKKGSREGCWETEGDLQFDSYKAKCAGSLVLFAALSGPGAAGGLCEADRRAQLLSIKVFFYWLPNWPWYSHTEPRSICSSTKNDSLVSKQGMSAQNIPGKT